MDDAVLGPHTRTAAAMLQTDERTRKMSTEMREPMEPGSLVKAGCYRAKEGEHVHRRLGGGVSSRRWLCMFDDAYYVVKWSDLRNPREITDAESLREEEPDGSQEPVPVRIMARCPNNDYLGYHCHGLIMDPKSDDSGNWTCPVGEPVAYYDMVQQRALTVHEDKMMDALMAYGDPLGVTSLLPPPGDPALERLEVLRGEIRARTLRGTSTDPALEALDMRVDLAALADAIDILIEREVRR